MSLALLCPGQGAQRSDVRPRARSSGRAPHPLIGPARCSAAMCFPPRWPTTVSTMRRRNRCCARPPGSVAGAARQRANADAGRRLQHRRVGRACRQLRCGHLPCLGGAARAVDGRRQPRRCRPAGGTWPGAPCTAATVRSARCVRGHRQWAGPFHRGRHARRIAAAGAARAQGAGIRPLAVHVPAHAVAGGGGRTVRCRSMPRRCKPHACRCWPASMRGLCVIVPRWCTRCRRSWRRPSNGRR